jgi:hypothetical protein
MAKTESTGKPERIEWKRSWDGPNGTIHYFDIEFEDGTAGEFSTKTQNQTKFTVGKEVNYSVEDASNARGAYIKIDIVKPKPGEPGSGGVSHGKGSGGSHMSPEVEASITMSVCLDSAALVILKSGKAPQVKDDLIALHVLAEKFFKHIMEKSKGDRQISINYQSRLKEVTTYLMDDARKAGSDKVEPFGFNELKIKSSEDILKYVDMEVAFLQMKMGQAK